jgi:hypothetical protein
VTLISDQVRQLRRGEIAECVSDVTQETAEQAAQNRKEEMRRWHRTCETAEEEAQNK